MSFIVGGLVWICLGQTYRNKSSDAREEKKNQDVQRMRVLGWTPLGVYKGSSFGKHSMQTTFTSPGQTLNILFAELQTGTNNLTRIW